MQSFFFENHSCLRRQTSGFGSRPCGPLSSAGRAEPPRSASCYPSGPERSSVGRRGARRPLGRVGELPRHPVPIELRAMPMRQHISIRHRPPMLSSTGPRIVYIHRTVRHGRRISRLQPAPEPVYSRWRAGVPGDSPYLRRHACAARRKKTCCIAFGASPPTPRDACTTRGSQTHRAARSRSTTSTPASLLVDPRPDAQDLTSRALARSWPSHVCALADEPELGGFELIAAVPEQRPPSPPLEVPAAP